MNEIAQECRNFLINLDLGCNPMMWLGWERKFSSRLIGIIGCNQHSRLPINIKISPL